MNRICALDGWRGIAILFVLLNHAITYLPRLLLIQTRGIPAQSLQLGNFGVDIFFVLSGFIITTRMLQEWSDTGTIQLRRFYVRRAFRILPITVLYLVVLCVLARCVAVPDFRWSDVAGSLLFVRNYQGWYRSASIYTAHFWTLSIEEQFYLAWPCLLQLGRRKAAGMAAAVLALVCAVWRSFDLRLAVSAHLSWIHPTGNISYPIRTDVRMDGLLLGAAMAILVARPEVRAKLVGLPSWVAPASAVCAFCCVMYWFPYPTMLTYCCIAVAISSSVYAQPGVLQRCLSARPLVWIGRVSFSLYVWQQIFLLHPEGVLPLGRLNLLPWSLLASFAVAAASYYCVERPLNNFGHAYPRSLAASLAK